MTTARRRKASNRSVAIRRVKSRKSQNAKRLKTFRRKTRNVVMRGGASDLSLYYEPAISPPRCIIIKKSNTPKDILYLFFANNITSDEINKYVRSAMGQEGATFEPQFIAQPNTNTDLKLDDLFVKLGSRSDIFSYSSIASGYLQRTDPQKDKPLVTSNTHKIEMTGSPQNITGWRQILDNLNKNGHKFIEITGFSVHLPNYISSDVAEKGYSWAEYKQEQIKQHAISEQNFKCDKQIVINPNIQDNITYAKEQLSNWPGFIENKALRTVRQNTDRNTFIAQVNSNIDRMNPTFDYDRTINEIKSSFESLKKSDNYDTLSDACKQRFDKLYDKSKYRTIGEIYDGTVSAK